MPNSHLQGLHSLHTVPQCPSEKLRVCQGLASGRQDASVITRQPQGWPIRSPTSILKRRAASGAWAPLPQDTHPFGPLDTINSYLDKFCDQPPTRLVTATGRFRARSLRPRHFVCLNDMIPPPSLALHRLQFPRFPWQSSAKALRPGSASSLSTPTSCGCWSQLWKAT